MPPFCIGSQATSVGDYLTPTGPLHVAEDIAPAHHVLAPTSTSVRDCWISCACPSSSSSASGLLFTSLPLMHSKPTFGYAVEADDGTRFAYFTDTLDLPPQTEVFLQAWQADGLAIYCSYPPQDAPPRGHNDWPMALAAIASVRPRRAWLTHIGHVLDDWILRTKPTLAEHTSVAQDGEQVDLVHRRDLGTA